MSNATGSKKRKAEASSSSSKRARTDAAHAQSLVDDILADPETYPVSNDPRVVRQSFVELAQYARALEQEVGSGSSKPAPKTTAQIKAAAEKLRKAAASGIKKQMTWKPSCKTGSAKWIYDGVCADPEIFSAVLGLDGPPNFKMKKMKKEEFEDLIGDLRASIRYDTLRLSSDVNIRWQPEEGTFKFSGTYGK